jgi:nucleolar complex protein 3
MSSLRQAETEGRGKAFTRDWGRGISLKETLPIKISGKIVVPTREVLDVEKSGEDVDDDSVDEGGAVAGDGEDVDMDAGDEPDADYEDFTKSIQDDNETEEAAQLTERSIKQKQSESITKARMQLATICTVVTTDPETAVKKRKYRDPNDDGSLRLTDLLDYFNHPSAEIVELAILSGVIVFKDIIPGYRIRAGTEKDDDGDVRLKKETKKLKDFEKCLLLAYQKYLKFLEARISAGLGTSKKNVKVWTEEAVLGFSALRAECELLRAVPHFNFRSILVKTIVTRACQPCEKITSLCCETLKAIFIKDVEGELSYEVVKGMAAAMADTNFQVTEEYIRILENVKVRVHADEAKNIRRKAKMERRKRRKLGDEVEAGLMEAGGVVTSSIQRYQADSLHELILIYFR